MATAEKTRHGEEEEEEEEKDTYEQMLEQSGCVKQHHALQDCFYDNDRDWRKCQGEMKAFKECMARQQKRK